jgi:hypothetical protein
MDALEKLIRENCWRFTKGYPDMDNPKDKEFLYSIIENIIGEQEEDILQAKELEKEDLEKMLKAFSAIKDPYSRYLSVFNYFDPYSLGTISEVLLTKLLNTVEGVEADHVGGGQGLADLKINGKPVSLKTTDSKKPIGLGSDEVNTNPADAKFVASEMTKLIKDNPSLKDLTIKELKDKIPSETYNKILARINSIVNKLSGPDNEEYFVWVEKVSNKGFLESIVIHIEKYDKTKTLNTFLDSKFYGTEKAWGLLDDKNKIIVQADSTGKLLNIKPEFVKKSTNEKNIKVDLSSEIKTKPEDIKEKVPEEFFKALDIIHKNLF